MKEHHGQLAELLGSLCTGGAGSLCTGLGANSLVLGPRLSHSEPLPPDLASEGTKVPPPRCYRTQRSRTKKVMAMATKAILS